MRETRLRSLFALAGMGAVLAGCELAVSLDRSAVPGEPDAGCAICGDAATGDAAPKDSSASPE